MNSHFFFFFVVLFLVGSIGPATAVAVDFDKLASLGLGNFNANARSTFHEALTTKHDILRTHGHTYFRIPDADKGIRTFLSSTHTVRDAIAPYSLPAVDIKSKNNDVVFLTIATPWSVLDSIGHLENVKENFEQFLWTLATRFVVPLLNRGLAVKQVRLRDISIVNVSDSNSENFLLRNPAAAKRIDGGQSIDNICSVGGVTYAFNTWFDSIYDRALSNGIKELAKLVTNGSRYRNIYLKWLCGIVDRNYKNLIVKKEVPQEKLGEQEIVPQGKLGEQEIVPQKKIPKEVKNRRANFHIKNFRDRTNGHTEVKNLMFKGDVERAERMLGNPVEVKTAGKTHDDNLKDVEWKRYDLWPQTDSKTLMDSLDQVCRRLETTLQYKQPLGKDIIASNDSLEDICRRLEIQLKGTGFHPLDM